MAWVIPVDDNILKCIYFRSFIHYLLQVCSRIDFQQNLALGKSESLFPCRDKSLAGIALIFLVGQIPQFFQRLAANSPGAVCESFQCRIGEKHKLSVFGTPQIDHRDFRPFFNRFLQGVEGVFGSAVPVTALGNHKYLAVIRFEQQFTKFVSERI